MIDLSILKKIYKGDKQQAIDAILATYAQQGYAVVNYLYFAQLMRQRLIEGTPTLVQQYYYHALLQGDFLFADGIALQLFYRWMIGESYTPSNLNGTDFCPLLLRTLISFYGAKNIHLGIFNVRDERISKNEDYMDTVNQYISATYGCEVSFARQCHYREREDASPRGAYQTSLDEDESTVRILLNFVGAPHQEILVDTHHEFITKNNILALNQGGTIDFRMGVEKRAPKRIIQSRVLETPRRILSNPQKNLRKFLRMFGVVRVRGKIIYTNVFGSSSYHHE